MNKSLGEFIRLHRQKQSPQSFDLPSFGRRRTPGLRREELAQLCGVSPTWLTWLEQGRSVTASAKLLDTLAIMLRLNQAERAYLFELGQKLDPQIDKLAISDLHPEFNQITQAIHTPCYILDATWNVLAWNHAASTLFTGWLDVPQAADKTNLAHTDRTNLLYYMFLNPNAQILITNWLERAQRLVAEFRADSGKHLTDEPFASLIQTLCQQSTHFKQFWQTTQVMQRDGRLKHFNHPQLGSLTYQQIAFNLSNEPGYKLIMLIPLTSLTTSTP